MTLGEHLEELRRRVIYALLGVAVAVAVSLAFAREVILAFEWPYQKALAEIGMPWEKLAVLSVGAGFDVYMRVALYCGLLLAGPWIIYQAWAFVAAGLHPRERRVVLMAVPAFVGLFLGGAAFFVAFVAVPAIKFLIGFDRWLDLDPVVTLQSQIGFMTDMVLAFGLAFQTPLAILLLAKVGLVSMKTLRKYRRHAIVAIAAFAAVFAPPDALSMLALGLPMWLLYELGVVLAYFLALRKKKD